MKHRITLMLLLLLVISCSTTEPDGGSLELKLEDVSSTEVWLRLSKINTSQPANVSVKRDGEEVYNFTLTKSDTVLKDTKLQPAKSYSYIATNLTSGVTVTTTTTTMDTTNHELNWSEYTFGGGAFSGSYFNDVAIIDENNIWAVGAVYLKDSLGNDDPTPYNAVHWDGNKWEAKRISILYRGNLITAPLYGIFASSSNDIWMSSGIPIHGDGDNWVQYHLFDMNILAQTDGSILKIWGRSSADIFFVGNNGTIVHYLNGTWQKIESGTEIRLTDIYGKPDGETILVCGWDYDHPGTALFEIKNQKVRHIWDGLSNLGEYVLALNSIWSAKSEIWTAGAFVFRQSTLFPDVGHLARYQSGKLFEPGNGVLCLRGTDNNNVYIAGDLGMLWHYNGYSWYKYEELYGSELDRRINGMAVKENIVVAVGWKNSYAWIAVGRK